MGRSEELELFLSRADEFIESQYILADVKIAGLLKAVAGSETLLALFKNCLNGFDYGAAKKKYLVKSKYLTADKGEFILPGSSREILAFTLIFLTECDAKKIDLGEFINKYFYEDGSFSAGYHAFLNQMIKPFRNTVKTLMESVIEGRLQDPVEAFVEEEEKKRAELDAEEKKKKEEKELLSKSYGQSLKELRELLLKDRQNVESSKLSEEEKRELLLIISMLANVIESSDVDAIVYAFSAYKFAVRAHRILFCGREKKTQKLVRDVLNGI